MTKGIEEWRPIIGGSGYEVSSLGRVRSEKSGSWRVLKEQPGERYPFVVLRLGGRKQWNVRIHQLVCVAFHGPKPSPKHEVAHNDGCRTNNVPSNLRWALHGGDNGNMADRKRHGTSPVTISNECVAKIRKLRSSGHSFGKIAKWTGVAQSHVWRICAGIARRELT